MSYDLWLPRFYIIRITLQQQQTDVYFRCPQSGPLILHRPLQHNCTEVTAGIVRVHTMDSNLPIT